MANTEYWIDSLKNAEAWVDDRNHYTGGYGWRGDRPLSFIKEVAIHHTVTNPTGNGRKEVDFVADIHLNQRKWGGIGYNIIVTSEESNGFAKAHYVGDIGSIRAHTPNMKGAHGIPSGQGNYYILAVSIVGQLHQEMPTEAQIRTVHEIVKDLIYVENDRLPLLASWDNMKGHRDFDYTACPGNFQDYRDLIINYESMSNCLPDECKAPLDANHEAVKAAIDGMKGLTEAAEKTPVGSNEPRDYVTVTTEENLNRYVNIGTLMTILNQYHYNQASVEKGRIAKMIEES